jgi:TRAP-type C4-dicarboxylate transport system substrate-binding protein
VVPVQSNLNEAFTAMQTGVYEGWVMFADGVASFRLHELSKQFVDVGFGCIPIPVLTANRDSWRGLPPDIQRIMREEAAAWSDHLGEQSHLRTEAGFATMRQAGLTVRAIDEEERRAWAMSLPNWRAADGGDPPRQPAGRGGVRMDPAGAGGGASLATRLAGGSVRARAGSGG